MSFKIAERWFEHRCLDDEISLVWEPHADPFARCNMWHVRGRTVDLLIDTGLGVRELRPYVEQVFGRRVTAVITHAHFDHSGSFHEFDERWMHAAEAVEMATGLAWGALCRNQMTADVIERSRAPAISCPTFCWTRGRARTSIRARIECRGRTDLATERWRDHRSW